MPAARRKLTAGERALVASVFGDAIDCDAVEIVNSRWFPFQPREVGMTPSGNIHIAPGSSLWSEDFACERPSLQAFFIHEMTHVWQSQTRGRFYLVMMRHPFCRYSYKFKEGRPFERYGLEQQAEIVRHVFMLRKGLKPRNEVRLEQIEPLLPFGPRASGIQAP